MEVKITTRQQQIIDFIAAEQKVSVNQIAVKFGFSVNTAGVHLQDLRRLGMVAPTGLARGTTWSVCRDEVLPARFSKKIKMHPIEKCPSIWEYARRLVIAR